MRESSSAKVTILLSKNVPPRAAHRVNDERSLMKKNKLGMANEMSKKRRKHMKRMITGLVGCCMLLCSPIPAGAKDYDKAVYDWTRWEEIQKDYLPTKTDRLIFVKYQGGSHATVEMWKKGKCVKTPFFDLASESASAAEYKEQEDTIDWEQIVSCRAYVGKNGLYKVKQGDRKTPVGIYNITMAFGRKKSPGTAGISYTKLNKYHYWSSERATYNRFVDVRTLNRTWMRGEHLIDYDPHYNYALAMDYNKKCTYLKGSAIFLHCFGTDEYTAGCIAVPEKDMKTIVQNTTVHTKICIYKK